MIAGAMSKAYDEIVTISLVSFEIRQEYFKFKTCPPVVTCPSIRDDPYWTSIGRTV